MCRFQRHGREPKSAWAGTAHMRENLHALRILPVFVVRSECMKALALTWLHCLFGFQRQPP